MTVSSPVFPKVKDACINFEAPVSLSVSKHTQIYINTQGFAELYDAEKNLRTTEAVQQTWARLNAHINTRLAGENFFDAIDIRELIERHANVCLKEQYPIALTYGMLIRINAVLKRMFRGN